MGDYDPLHTPEPEWWLALDEGERIDLALRFHRRAPLRLSDAGADRSHAAIHAAIETQVAMGEEMPVARTVQRLCAGGLDRHDAIHAADSVLATHLYDLLKQVGPTGDPNAAYWGELEWLAAEGWSRDR